MSKDDRTTLFPHQQVLGEMFTPKSPFENLPFPSTALIPRDKAGKFVFLFKASYRDRCRICEKPLCECLGLAKTMPSASPHYSIDESAFMVSGHEQINVTRLPDCDLTFAELREANVRRAAFWGDDGSWSIADWSNATAGEAGEQIEAVFNVIAFAAATNAKIGLLADAIKKARRHQTGVKQATGPQSWDIALKAAAMEIGDVAVYLDLLAKSLGLELADCVRDTFNRVSDRENMPVRL